MDDWSDSERRRVATSIGLPGWRVRLTRLADGRWRAHAKEQEGWELSCGHRTVSATGRTSALAVAGLARATQFHLTER